VFRWVVRPFQGRTRQTHLTQGALTSLTTLGFVVTPLRGNRLNKELWRFTFLDGSMNQKHQSHGSLPRAMHDALLRQLSVERTWLQAVRESLIVLRRSAVIGDLATLESALREQAALAATRDDLAVARRTIFTQVTGQLEIRGPATLGVIAARLEPQSRPAILAARRELLGGAKSVRTLSAGAMSIIAQKRLILDGVLGDLLGAAPTEARYTSDGQRQDITGRALVECRT
jgi:hypothetical protein